jgi:hypothetical protein
VKLDRIGRCLSYGVIMDETTEVYHLEQILVKFGGTEPMLLEMTQK